MSAGRVWLSLNGVRHHEAMADGLPTEDLYMAVDLCRGDAVKIIASR